MKILIINDYFPPSESMGVRRVLSWAKSWASQGIEVHIGSTQLDLTLPEELNSSSVYIHPMRNKVEMELKSHNISGNETSIARRALRFLKSSIFANLLEYRFVRVLPLYNHLKKVINDHSITHIVSSNPSFASHLVASMLKKNNRGLVWVADYRDLFSGNPIFPGCFPFTKLEVVIEKSTLYRANSIVTINRVLGQHLSELTSKSIHIVENGIEMADLLLRQDEASCQSIDFSSEAKLNIVYTGAVLMGLYDISPLVSAVERLCKDRLIDESAIKIWFFGQQDGVDKADIQKRGLSKFFKFNGPVKREDSLKIQESADALLFLGAQENGGKGINGVVSGKVFEYLTAGAPIIGLGVRPEMVVYDILEESQTAICMTNCAKELADKILMLLDCKKAGKAIRVSCNTSLLERYSRDSLAQKMLTIIRES